MKNKILGSALMIAGTTIGAGMLAMPLTSAGMGFGATLALLIGLWALLAYTGLLFMEVYQTAPRQDVGVGSLAEQYLGIGGRLSATISLLVLLYALLAAYISGGGSLLSGILPEMGNAKTTEQIGILIFTIILGSFVVMGIKGVDGLTRVLFIGKIIAFVAVLILMLPKAKLETFAFPSAIFLSNSLYLLDCSFFSKLLISLYSEEFIIFLCLLRISLRQELYIILAIFSLFSKICSCHSSVFKANVNT